MVKGYGTIYSCFYLERLMYRRILKQTFFGTAPPNPTPPRSLLPAILAPHETALGRNSEAIRRRKCGPLVLGEWRLDAEGLGLRNGCSSSTHLVS